MSVQSSKISICSKKINKKNECPYIVTREPKYVHLDTKSLHMETKCSHIETNCMEVQTGISTSM